MTSPDINYANLPLRAKVHILAESLANHPAPDHPDTESVLDASYAEGYHDATTSIGLILLNLLGEKL